MDVQAILTPQSLRGVFRSVVFKLCSMELQGLSVWGVRDYFIQNEVCR